MSIRHVTSNPAQSGLISARGKQHNRSEILKLQFSSGDLGPHGESREITALQFPCRVKLKDLTVLRSRSRAERLEGKQQQQAQRQEHRQAQRQANRQAQRQGQAPRQIQSPPQRSGQGQAPRQIQPPLQRSGPGQQQKSTTAFNSEQRKQIKKMVNDSFIQNMMKHQHKKLHQDMKRIKRENSVS